MVDDAAYHFVLGERCPTSALRKNDIEDWLFQHEIPFSSGLLKTELYDLVKLHKPRQKYVLDVILSAHGRTVLR